MDDIEYFSYADWLNDTEQIKGLQEECESAEEELKRGLYFNSAVLEITQILDDFNKLYASLSRMSYYLMRSDLTKPEVHKKILMCRDNVLKSNTCFIEVGNELYDIMIEREKKMEKLRVQLAEFDKPMPNGRMISKDAFSESDGKNIPIYLAGSAYNHSPADALGYGTVHLDENGIYADCELIESRIKSENISSASIYTTTCTIRRKENLVTDGLIGSISLILK